ncbi:hypothetical protein IX51_00675 [uncultured archaeon]|nr:hypothetical protein IX51_00675 [uncultured archaeon]
MHISSIHIGFIYEAWKGPRKAGNSQVLYRQAKTQSSLMATIPKRFSGGFTLDHRSSISFYHAGSSRFPFSLH